MLCWMLAVAQAAPELWLDVHLQAPGEQVDLAMPYSWLHEGVVTAELAGTIESVELDLRQAAIELEQAPVGTTREWWLQGESDAMHLVLSRQPEREGRTARRLVVESQPGDDRFAAPLFVTRAALKWMDLSTIGSVADWIHVDRALAQLGRLRPFTLVEMTVDGGSVRVATE